MSEQKYTDNQTELLLTAITNFLKNQGVIREDIIMLDGASCLMMLEDLDQHNNSLAERLAEIHSWAVCGAIATPEDMMQNIVRIVEVSDVTKEYERPLDDCEKKMIEDGLAKINAVKPGLDPEVEAKAEVIYNEEFKDQDGWVPWTVGGNSVMQDKARSIARARISNGKMFYAASVTSGNSHD